MYKIDMSKFLKDLKIKCIENNIKLADSLKEIWIIPQSLYYIKLNWTWKIWDTLVEKLRSLEIINIDDYVEEIDLVPLPDNAKSILWASLLSYYKKKGWIPRDKYEKYFKS